MTYERVRIVEVFPPHSRGWTVYACAKEVVKYVSPALAGMDLGEHPNRPNLAGFPRTRGDGPSSPNQSSDLFWLPPHARRRPPPTRRRAACCSPDP